MHQKFNCPFSSTLPPPLCFCQLVGSRGNGRHGDERERERELRIGGKERRWGTVKFAPKSTNSLIGWKRIRSKITIGMTRFTSTESRGSDWRLEDILASHINQFSVAFWRRSYMWLSNECKHAFVNMSWIGSFFSTSNWNATSYGEQSTTTNFCWRSELPILIMNWVCTFVNVSWMKTCR